jgi:EAL domain-containing protein (putative c-di-GMP-specific phosphodiesterase class I)
MLVNPELAIASRHALTNMGVRAAIDDFGTGYSSLSYLKSLPVHTIKIDQSFIRDIGENAISEAIIVATVGLAHTIGLTVIAEGVETSKQSEFLLSNRCGTMQGYHFYRPATCEATTALLSELNGGAVARPLTLSPPQVMRCATNAEPGSLTSASHGVASVEASCFG